MIRNARYERFVDKLVAERVRAGLVDLRSLAAALPGVFPTDVVAAVTRLNLNVSSTPHGGALRVSAEGLPALPPHPLDYDWRFTLETRQHLVASMRSRSDAIVLLGTPSLIGPALTSECARRDVWLLDLQAGAAGLAYKSSVRCVPFDALSETAPTLGVSFVLADPPWYPEHMASFVGAAARLLRVGGECWLSVPGAGTRPGIAVELETLQTVVRLVGLNLVESTEREFSYVTPFFEYNALRAAGIGAPLAQWRHGDRWILRKEQDAEPARTRRPADGWREISVGRSRWRVREEVRTGAFESLLKPLGQCDVIPSVSRRHETRKLANVWTSGNRAYRSSDTSVLIAILTAIAEGLDASAAVEAMAGRRLRTKEVAAVWTTADRCREVVTLETQEHGDYEHWLGL